MGVRPDVLRVSVVGERTRVDLVVPSAVTVADLLPDLVRRVGGGDPPESPVRLALLGGPPLEGGSGLADQGVEDGALLTLLPPVAHAPPVHDDLAHLVAEVVEAVPRPGADVARWTALGLGGLLTVLGAGGAVLLGAPAGAWAAAATGVVLLTAAHLPPARRSAGRGSPVAAAATWLAVLQAGVAGLAVGLVGVGAAWLVVGAVAATSRGRAGPVLAVPVAGAVLLASGLVDRLTSLPEPAVLAGALVLVVVAGDLVPWLVAALTGLLPPPLGEQPPAPVVPDTVAAGVRRAHGLLLVLTAATGLVLLTLGPVVASAGPWSAAVVLLCCAVVSLRARGHRLGLLGPVGLVAGLAPLPLVAAAVWWSAPDLRGVLVVAVLVAGGLGLAASWTPLPRSARAGRAAEVAESLATVALPPTLLVATGMLDVVSAVVG